MWKLFVGFVVFAVLAVWLLTKGGANVDMGGEKHGADAVHAPEPAAAPAAAVSAPSAPAAPASAAK